MNNQLVSSSSFSSPPLWKYDVFLSFRGEDTRTNFTDHFYKALDGKAITTFIDHQLKRGEGISQALLEAIDESRISIIIFSKNYASSRWCLEELVRILECRKSRKQIVLPVFYKVDPSDVRKQTSSFGDAFTEKFKFEDNKEKILTWRSALTDAANLSGYTFKEGEYEATFISKIVKEISVFVLQRTHLYVAKHPVGMESCVKEVEKLLGDGGNDPCVVGIWGASGIGKTTVAKAVYNAIAYKFEGSCFLADVREKSMQYGGLLELQNTLLSEISGSEWKVVNPDIGNSLIQKLLRRKKFLLILDDVDDLKQLNNLVQVKWLGEGGTVIITTKKRGLLKSYDVELIYEVRKLEDDKALELLSLNAFGKEEPSDDYLGLARRAISYAQGHPLALNLIGSHLRNKGMDRWQAMLNSYDSYEGEPFTDIQRILRKSYDAWDNVVQQVFLDIACFFKGRNKDHVLQILRSSKLNPPQDVIEVLIENAIITIEGNRILMHDLLEKMGKHIVREESPVEPGERSRLWHHEDVDRVLSDKRGTKKIRGIVVELPKPDVITLNAESFLGMENLEIFINRNAQFSGHVDYLPNDLRWVELGGRSNIYQKHTVVFNLSYNHQPRHLVKFDVSYSGVRQLKGFKNLPKLTYINLNGCEFLEKIPNLSGSPYITHLYLRGCTSLVEIDDSVGFLDKLVILDLSGCSKLTKFVTRLGLRSLKELSLFGCRRLERFPKIDESMMESVWSLNIQESGVRKLPSSIAFVTRLQRVKVNGWENCTNIYLCGGPKLITAYLDILDDPCIFSFPNLDYHPRHLIMFDVSYSGIKQLNGYKNLAKLTWMNLSGCEFLEKFPNLSESPNIKHLNLSGCKNLVEVDVGFHDKLEYLDLSFCSNLTRFATRLGSRSLQILSLRGCRGLKSLEIEGKMESLWILDIGESGRRELPSIAYFPRLEELNASGCELQNVPDLSGSPNIKVLNLSGCKNLVEVDVGFLDKLEFLYLSRCSNLTRFATRLGSRSLRTLSLRGCRGLKSLEIEGKMKSLCFLDIGESGIRELPSIAYFPRLKKLITSGCEFQLLPFGKKVKFDKVSSCTTNLHLYLDLEGCNLSESDFLVPLDCWSALTKLNLSRNNFVNLPDCISKAVNLKRLFLRDCKRLREIPILPPELEELFLEGCTSLDKIPKLPPRLEELSLCNCSGLSGDEVAKLENNLLNEEIGPRSQENMIYRGNEIPRWFSYTSKSILNEDDEEEYDKEEEEDDEFSFEIPLNLQERETLLGLTLSFVFQPRPLSEEFGYDHYNFCIHINEASNYYEGFKWYGKAMETAHVVLMFVDLKKQGDICKVKFQFPVWARIKSCGVHPRLRKEDERLPLSLGPTSLGSIHVLIKCVGQMCWSSKTTMPFHKRRWLFSRKTETTFVS